MPPKKRTVCHCTHVPKKGGGFGKVTIKVPPKPKVKIGSAVKVGKAPAKKAPPKKAPPKKAAAKKPGNKGAGAKCKCS